MHQLTQLLPLYSLVSHFVCLSVSVWICVHPHAVELPLEDRRGYYTWRWSYWQWWAAWLGNQTWILCKSRNALHPWASLQGLCLVYPSQRCRYHQPSLQVWRLNDRGKLVGFRLFFFLQFRKFLWRNQIYKTSKDQVMNLFSSYNWKGMVTSRKCPVAAGRAPLLSEGKEKTWVIGENSLILKLYWTLNWIFL